jgi:hypothetical protein
VDCDAVTVLLAAGERARSDSEIARLGGEPND